MLALKNRIRCFLFFTDLLVITVDVLPVGSFPATGTAAKAGITRTHAAGASRGQDQHAQVQARCRRRRIVQVLSESWCTRTLRDVRVTSYNNNSPPYTKSHLRKLREILGGPAQNSAQPVALHFKATRYRDTRVRQRRSFSQAVVVLCLSRSSQHN